jgi:hypothetical protein
LKWSVTTNWSQPGRRGFIRAVAALLLCVLVVELLRADDPPRFVRGLNFNGPAVEIDGQAWEGKDSRHYRTDDQAFENQSVTLRPPTDAQRALMIRSSRWNHQARIELTDLPNARCQVFVYVWEDNNPETFSLFLQGEKVAPDIRSGNAGEWRRLGPFVVEVKDGSITLTTDGGAANLSGIEIWEGTGAVPEPRPPELVGFPAVTPEVARQFHETIAPLFSKHCLECHNGTDYRGGMDLSEWKAAGKGGESGAVVVAGKPEESLLWQYIESDEMPKERPPLSADEKAVLRTWIEKGAVWGEPRIDPFLFSTARRAGYDWWSLQPIRHRSLPAVKDRSWGINEIDAFVLARLEAESLHPAPPADRRTLIRRLSFDVTGLPPTPEEVQRFVADADPRAYERLVDRLLDSPHYGERWARHWLDVIRFGESQGFERNKIRDNAWRFRDWVIRAFNDNLPYDEFVRRQIAGDVHYPDDLTALIATGYHVCGTWDQVGFLEGSAEMQRGVKQDHLEDVVATLGQAFLGLTINCARCHDHKFDPISQREYYQIASLLDGVVTQAEKEREGITLAVPGGSAGSPLETADFAGVTHAVIPREPETTYVLTRGDYRQPTDVVSPGGLKALTGLPVEFGLEANAPEGPRRAKLAEWLTDPRNPLIARVFVNRVWYYHFGRGLVDTPSDFGFNGGQPSHPELLDYLAARFIDSGWDVKALQRLILTSATYRQQSRVAGDKAAQVDADNRLLWRANLRRPGGNRGAVDQVQPFGPSVGRRSQAVAPRVSRINTTMMISGQRQSCRHSA